MKHLVFTLALALFISVQAMAQFQVNGQVTDQHGNPLAGAAVKLNNQTTATNQQGNFIINNNVAGTNQLQVSFMGFETYFQSVTGATNQTVKVILAENNILTGEVTVSAIKARKSDPVAYTEISKDEISKNNYGQDIPYLLSMTPGLVASSDAGNGVGYTSLRLRGTDITRINITVNGIPLNDAESQGVYWVNMPDFASSVEQVQVQRGVGTSTNGAASFGGSINFSTLNGPGTAQVIVDNSFGSYNTFKNSATIKSGLLNNQLAFDLRLSKMSSDGYIDRATSDLKSYYFSAGYYGTGTTVKFVNFAGNEKTYQAWHGVPKAKLNKNTEAMLIYAADDGWSVEETENLLKSNPRTFNRYLYKNQTDNYQQSHYQLHFSQKLYTNLLLTAALHYTRGKGYYESYKYNKKFTSYGFPFSELIVNGTTIKRTDLIAQKWLDNHFYGANTSVIYNTGNVHLVSGLAWNQYDGDHYGDVIWSAVNNGATNSHRWYQSNGLKTDFNWFTKASIDITNKVNLYGDLQFRQVSHQLKGFHDDMSDITREIDFLFFNPKYGLNYKIDNKSRAYASMAIANREPSRSDFRDADANKLPKKEKLTDFEAGFEMGDEKSALQFNLFYMKYKDQLVLTGEINNVGAPKMTNVPESFRKGIEISGGTQITSNLNWMVNVVMSRNKIKKFTEYVDNWATWSQEVMPLGTTDIAFSPNLTFSSRFNYDINKNWQVQLQSKYADKQYIDNTSNKERMLNSYFVNDLNINYNTKLKGFANIDLGLQINNLFSENYIANAWVYSYYTQNASDETVRRELDGYFPQAPRHYMLKATLTF